jgi:hypothetical protein
MPSKIEVHDNYHLLVEYHARVAGLILMMSEIRYCWCMEKLGPSPASPCLGEYGCQRCFDATLDSRHCLGGGLVALCSWEGVFGSAGLAPKARECNQRVVLVIGAQN